MAGVACKFGLTALMQSLCQTSTAHTFASGRGFDFVSDAGFSLACNSVRSLAENGISPLAPTCSSWVFLSRSSSGRSYLCSLGFEEMPWVQDADLMAARVALIVVLVALGGSTFIVEQPLSSLFFVTQDGCWRSVFYGPEKSQPGARPSSWVLLARAGFIDDIQLIWTHVVAIFEIQPRND